jgi:hypothetical protein
MMNKAAKDFDALATNLNVRHNYFDDLTKLFSDLCLAKFLNTAKSCNIHILINIHFKILSVQYILNLIQIFQLYKIY